MSKEHTFILFANDTTAWTVATGGGQIVQAEFANVPATLRSLGYRGQPLVLALPSTWCLSATIDTTGLGRHDRSAAVYRLEDSLPIAVEDVAAEIVRALDAKHALGVCVRVDRVQPLLESLEAADVNVAVITPAAMLAAQAAADAKTPSIVLSREGKFVDVIGIRDGDPLAWGFSADDPPSVELQVELIQRQFGSPGELPVRQPDSTRQSLAVIAAREVLNGKMRPWIQLRRDALAPRDRLTQHRRAINFALAAAAALFLAIAAAAIIRAVRFEHAARSAEAAMADEFHRRFPNWDVPVNVAAVVESERRKQIESAHSSSSASALASLRDVLGAVPTQVKVAVDSMSFDGSSFDMTGQVSDPAEIQAITSAARSAGFEVPTPQARRQSNGTWSFTISGTRTGAGGRPASVAVGR